MAPAGGDRRVELDELSVPYLPGEDRDVHQADAESGEDRLRDELAAVTDSNNSLVFKLERGRLATLRLGRPIFLPNGIAVDPAAGRLFVADANGILVHDIATAESWHLEPETTSIAAIDGMNWHKGALIGVQNQTSPARLLQIRPDASARRASVAVLLADQELSNSATVAATDDEAFVYVRPGGEDGGDQPRLVRVRL